MNGKQAAAIALTLIIAIPILAGYAFASESSTRTQAYVEDTVSLSDILLNDTTYYYSEYSGPANNGALFGTVNYFAAPAYVSTGSNESSITVGSLASTSLTLTYGVLNDLDSMLSSTEYYFETSFDTTIRLIYSDDSTETIQYDSGVFIRSGSTCYIKDTGDNTVETYTLVSNVYVGVDSQDPLTVYYYADGSTYAEAAYGWTLPATVDNYHWINGYANESVTFYLHMDTNTTVTFSPTDEWLSDATGLTFTLSSAGQMTIGYNSHTYALGAYDDVQIVYDLNAATCTIAGIADWPAMNVAPAAYNSVSFDIVDSFTDSNFTAIYITGSTSAIWRCDSADIVAGTFPVTQDFTLKMGALFPDKEYVLKLHSIGLYGDSIRIGGTTYTVTDGTITLDGETVSVRGLEIRVVKEDNVWVRYVNDVRTGSAVTAPTIYFGGLWSLTATAEILDYETVTVEEWAPGQFAFDKDNFVLMLLLCSVAVFVALGFTAGRSGGKALALIVTCGGAAVIALMMV